MYRHSPESGDLWFTSRRLNNTICSPSEGWWFHGEGQHAQLGQCRSQRPSHPCFGQVNRFPALIEFNQGPN
jgi:hypothetical protein